MGLLSANMVAIAAPHKGPRAARVKVRLPNGRALAMLPAGVSCTLTYRDGSVVTVPRGAVLIRVDQVASAMFLAPGRVSYDAAGRHRGLIVRVDFQA